MSIKKTDTTVDTTMSITPRGRTPRKKVYERVREAVIPKELVEHFKKDNYDLKLIRWSLNGEEDYRYLHRREREGYEFVTEAELPEFFKRTVNVMSTKMHPGLVTIGDLCLMKVDSDLRNSRRKAYQDGTARDVNSVDIHVLEKKGFRNLGTRSQPMKETSFQE